MGKLDNEGKMFFKGLILGMLIMSQIAGILGSAGYTFPNNVKEIWGAL